jgi:hypothetical protein
MCQKLTVDLLEFPEQMYITPDQLRTMGLTGAYTDEMQSLLHKLRANWYLPDSFSTDEIFTAYDKAFSENASFFGIKTEYFKSVVDDVNEFVNSYNYSDCDGMQDYYDVNFWFHKVDTNDCKVVPKTARVAKKETTPAETKQPEYASIEASGNNFSVTESEHTKTHEKIYLVKCLVTLSREDYLLLNSEIKKLGGYYSKFTHSFIFKNDPTELLKGLKVA